MDGITSIKDLAKLEGEEGADCCVVATASSNAAAVVSFGQISIDESEAVPEITPAKKRRREEKEDDP